MSRRVALGRIGRPHGVRGEVRLHPYNADSELIGDLSRLLTAEGRVLEVERLRPSTTGWLLKVRGADTREAAEALRDVEVWVPREALPEPEEGHYLADLVGLEVADGEGRRLGRVDGILPTGGTDLLRILDGDREWLLPAVEAFIVAVEPETGLIRVALPEGLLDLEEAP